MNPKAMIGKPCCFQYSGKELVGIIVDAVEAPPYGPGEIPDALVTVRGASGRQLTVSLVETYLKTTDK